MAVSYENMIRERNRVKRIQEELSKAKEKLLEATKDWEKSTADLRYAMDEVSVNDVMES